MCAIMQTLKDSENGETINENPNKEDDFAASFRLRSSLQDAIMAERYSSASAESSVLTDILHVLCHCPSEARLRFLNEGLYFLDHNKDAASKDCFKACNSHQKA